MSNLSRQPHSPSHCLHCLVAVAECPQCARSKTATNHFAVATDEKALLVVAMCAVKCRRFAEVLECFRASPHDDQRRPHGAVRFHNQSTFVETFSQLQELL